MNQTVVFKFSLGERVIHTITDFEGIVTGQISYISGCLQYLVKPKMVVKKAEEHKMPSGTWIDEQELEYLGIGVSVGSSPSGGLFHNDAPPRD